jgi:hypothetical protein
VQAAILAARSTAATAMRFFVAIGRKCLCAQQHERAFINASDVFNNYIFNNIADKRFVIDFILRFRTTVLTTLS